MDGIDMREKKGELLVAMNKLRAEAKSLETLFRTSVKNPEQYTVYKEIEKTHRQLDKLQAGLQGLAL